MVAAQPRRASQPAPVAVGLIHPKLSAVAGTMTGMTSAQVLDAVGGGPAVGDPQQGPTTTTHLSISGPFSLEEVALMGFGHRDERSFDGVMRLAFCLDGDYERQVGVEVRQSGSRLELRIIAALGSPAFDQQSTAAVAAQVARVLSVDHDGAAFDELCRSDTVLSRVHSVAPGFRPALFYSPYEAAVWSIVSARRGRSQGITVRNRLGQQFGATFELAGQVCFAVPTPSQLLRVDAVAGLPADRVPRLHAIAQAAQEGRLSAERLAALDPEQALQDLQTLPGIGPFYSALILIRACGAADVLPVDEAKSRDSLRELYGWESNLSDAEFRSFAERWRPWRTWVAVMVRALSPRLAP
jgi:DNA-3-methyladenine glycosylase II